MSDLIAAQLDGIVWHGIERDMCFGTCLFQSTSSEKCIQKSSNDLVVDGYLPFQASLSETTFSFEDASFVRQLSHAGVRDAPYIGGFVWHTIRHLEEAYIGDALSICDLIAATSPDSFSRARRLDAMESIRDFSRIGLSHSGSDRLQGTRFLYSLERGQLIPKVAHGDFSEAIAAAQLAVSRGSEWFLAQKKEEGAPELLLQAMRYALDGGKAFRVFLVREVATVLGRQDTTVDAIATAIELLHVASLVHDDLPPMDDDSLRRGKPTVHMKFDEATAILAGDALANSAFEVLHSDQLDLTDSQVVKIGRVLARSWGVNGVLGGQALDLTTEMATAPATLQEVENINIRKTGALIAAACAVGAILADASEEAVADFERFGHHIARAFQITDDLLDVSSAEVSLSPNATDPELEKATFVSLLGLEGAKRAAFESVRQATKLLARYGEGAKILRQVGQFVVNRDQ